MDSKSFYFVFALCCLWSKVQCTNEEARLLLLSVATDANDGFDRFSRSVKKYGVDLQVLGMGDKWEGGDMDFPGGGQKVILLKEAMEKLKDEKDLVVMFTDSYDVIFTDGPQEILKRFKKFDANVVFSAEDFCWPDVDLAASYPEVKSTEKRFLNSGGFIGYAPQIYSIINHKPVSNTDDDQLFYTQIFLDKEQRENLSIKLDTKAEIFQNLNGALDEVELKFKGRQSYLYNLKTGNTPVVIHGNGPIKHHLDRLGNYLTDNWTPVSGCQTCSDNNISLKGIEVDDLPTVYMAIFFDHPTPFAEDFFVNIAALNYPKSKISVFVCYEDLFHKSHVQEFVVNHDKQYKQIEVLNYEEEKLNYWTAKNKALDGCVDSDCQYFFYLEGDAQLENEDTLLELIQRNRSAIAPLLVRPEKMWSNFWGSINKDGFYERSDDYMELIRSTRRGLWNVPYITSAYLIHGYHIPKLLNGFIDSDFDPDMAICKLMRSLNIFMYVDNIIYYGHLVDSDNFDKTHLHNDMYELFDNKYTWEKKYLHEHYHYYLSEDVVHEQPCPDVFWQPLFTPTFCHHLVEEAENFGEWSGGKHDDPRLTGGYENVPTVDIHMNQLGWEKHWLQILADYIGPVANKLFKGYYTEARAIMNFMVRYKPTEQDRLRPHSDSSTYTVNLALNRPNIDYEGGGVRFLRYNCTVTDLRQGWFLAHPGRLTHHHEGLPTTAGTRYIMVSFIDP